MEDFFRAVAIGLGILMGTLQPGADPELQVSLRREGNQVVASASLVRGVSPAMAEALAEGVPMALTFAAGVDGRREGEATLTLANLPVTGEWQVTGPGDQRRIYPTLDQAQAVWTQGPPLGIRVPPQGPFALWASATLSFPGRSDWKADLVWRQGTVDWRKALGQVSEIPF